MSQPTTPQPATDLYIIDHHAPDSGLLHKEILRRYLSLHPARQFWREKSRRRVNIKIELFYPDTGRQGSGNAEKTELRLYAEHSGSTHFMAYAEALPFFVAQGDFLERPAMKRKMPCLSRYLKTRLRFLRTLALPGKASVIRLNLSEPKSAKVA